MPLNCASVVSSRISLGSLFQALAAENLNEVCPHLVLTCGRSNNVGSPKTDLQNCITFPCFLRVFVSVALFIVVLEWYPKKSKDAGQFASYRRLKFAQLKPEVDVSRWIWVQLFVSCCDFLLVFHVLFDLNAVRCR